MKTATIWAVFVAAGAMVVGQSFVISTFAGSGLPSGPSLNASLSYPEAIASDGTGNIYFVAGSAVYKLDTSGILTHVAGVAASGDSGDGGPAASATMGAPWGLAFDSAGALYISDDIPGDDYSPDAVRVRKVTPLHRAGLHRKQRR